MLLVLNNQALIFKPIVCQNTAIFCQKKSEHRTFFQQKKLAHMNLGVPDDFNKSLTNDIVTLICFKKKQALMLTVNWKGKKFSASSYMTDFQM